MSFRINRRIKSTDIWGFFKKGDFLCLSNIPRLSVTLSVCPLQNEIHFHGVLSMKNCFQGAIYTAPDAVQNF